MECFALLGRQNSLKSSKEHIELILLAGCCIILLFPQYYHDSNFHTTNIVCPHPQSNAAIIETLHPIKSSLF